MFKKLLKWISWPHNEQSVIEKRLIRIMRELKVEDYSFNWDRTSCLVEFHYLGNAYKLEHSIERAKKSGIILDNGLDCLMELTQSLEDIHGIVNRGAYKFDTWMTGMIQSPPEQNPSELQEEFDPFKRGGLLDYNNKDYDPLANEFSANNANRNHNNYNIRQRQQERKRGPLI